MTVFAKNALTQVSGFDKPIIAGELVYDQRTYWNLTLRDSLAAPVSLAGATISAQIVRRVISNIADTRAGLTFDLADYTPTPTPITLTIANRVDATGSFTLVIDDSAWSLIATDPQLDIAATSCAAFSGRIKISFPSVAGVPADDAIIFLLFLVRSDGVVVV